MKVRARINNYRSSARKVRLIAPLIKGLGAVEAQFQLNQLRKGCAEDVRKLIESVVANAKNNHGLEKENLVVSEFIVEEGRTMKRWRPRAHGRAAQILKRTCHVIVELEEKVAKDATKKETDESVKADTTEKIEKRKEKGSEDTKERKGKGKEDGEGKKFDKKDVGMDKDIFSLNNKPQTKKVEGQKIHRRKSF